LLRETRFGEDELRIVTDVVCPRGINRAARKSETNFTIEGLRRRCAPNTETTAVKPRVGIE